MAKKQQQQDLTDIFASTTKPTLPGAEPEPEKKRPSPVGVYLSQDELDQLAKIVQETGLKRGTLLTFAVRYFIRMYLTGKIEFETKKAPKLP